jgi:son of sevenless-like protein
MLNNFSTLTSIISALGTAPIARLKRTWDQVPQRIQATLETMRKLMASTKNFGEYRETLHAANPPCIPFFGKPPTSCARPELFPGGADAVGVRQACT